MPRGEEHPAGVAAGLLDVSHEAHEQRLGFEREKIDDPRVATVAHARREERVDGAPSTAPDELGDRATEGAALDDQAERGLALRIVTVERHEVRRAPVHDARGIVESFEDARAVLAAVDAEDREETLVGLGALAELGEQGRGGLTGGGAPALLDRSACTVISREKLELGEERSLQHRRGEYIAREARLSYHRVE